MIFLSLVLLHVGLYNMLVFITSWSL